MEKLGDVVTRLGEKIQGQAEQETVSAKPKAMPSARPNLLPDRHPVRDFFIADILDWALKNDRHSMEHPMFSLSKKPDKRIRRYEHNGISVTVTPSVLGLATIWDKDILLYCISVLMEGLNQGRKDVSRTVRLTAYDLLVTTNRTTGGRSYEELKAALERLRGTSITTNISTNGARQSRGFGLIDNWEIVERSPANGRMAAVEVSLNKWLYNAILACEVLTLNRDYFRLSGGLERRLYELARKHCGNQAKWKVSMEVLHKKSGSQATLVKFREMVKRAVAGDSLPDYRLGYDQTADHVVFYTKDVQKLAASLAG
jgi:plasmid replication initiation protein